MKALSALRGQCTMWYLALGLLLLVPTGEGQSNYASHGNSIEFEAPSEENNFGLPQQTILDGKVTKLDDLSPVIFLNRTKGALNCAAGIMQVELKFDVPFFGIAYADFDRNSACTVHGNGSLNFRLDLPLKGCGTVQNPQRVFTNNVVVRFHPGLEMDGDEVITVVCRYPPPVAPPPVGLLPRIELPAEAAPVEPPLKGFHILLIVCAILFLTLLLIGLGCSYYCLRHRRAPLLLLPPPSRPASSLKGTPLFPSSAASTASSQSDATTKLSSGTISMFEGLKIPRAHAGSSPPSALPPAVPLASTASDTLPSDYPSESLSSEEEMEVDSGGRMLLVTKADVKGIDRRPSTLSSAGSFENAGYTREEETFTAAVVPPPAPKFDVSVRVKRAPPSPPPPPSSATSDTTSVCSSMVATRQIDRNNLDTILEESHSARSMPPPMPLLQPSPPAPPTTFTYVPELHPQPSAAQHKMSERQQQMSQYSYRQKREWTDVEAARPMTDESDTILRGVDIIPAPANLRASPPPRSLVSLNTENTDTRSVSEIIESPPSRPYYAASPPPPPVLPTSTLRSQPPAVTQHIRKEEEIIQQTVRSEDLPEPPVVISRRPEITSHVVDDVFLRTVTERRTIEDIERRRRRAVAANPEPQPPPPKKWDVVIRNYPDPNPPSNPPPPSSVASSSTLCWESDYTDAAASDYQGAAEERTPEPREAPIWRDPGPVEEPVVSSKTPNWDVLIRVLQPPEPTPSERAPSEATTTEYDTAPETDTEDRDIERGRMSVEEEEEELAEMVRRTLTEADKEKWRQIITTESTLRTLLTEATVKEDFERIRRDNRYRTLFEPHKWDVIIRVLAPPPSATQPSQSRGPRPPYRRSKSTEWDNRSRRSSLPTLYEYDSDTGASSVSTRRRGDEDERESRSRAPSSPARSRRGGRAPSSVYSDAPFSVSEVVVADHSRPEAMSDVMSDASGHTSASSSYFAPPPPGGKRGAIRKALPKGYRRRRFEDSEEDDEDGVDGSLARSASQPSLARSASEFTERWAVEGRSRESYAEYEDFFEDGSSSLRSGRSGASSGAIGLRRGGASEGVGPGEDVVGSVRMTTTTTEVEKVRRVVRGADVWGGYGQE